MSMKYGLFFSKWKSNGAGGSNDFTCLIQNLSEEDLCIFKKYGEIYKKIKIDISDIENQKSYSLFSFSKEKKTENKRLDLLISDLNNSLSRVVGGELSLLNSNLTIEDIGSIWRACEFILPVIDKNSI